MYAKLYNSLERYHTAEVLEAAKAGTNPLMLQQQVICLLLIQEQNSFSTM